MSATCPGCHHASGAWRDGRRPAGDARDLRRARVRVFGSRVDDHLKGGDLDLHLEVEPGQATFANEMAFRDLIERPLEELKVDVVLRERGAPLSPIDQIALRDGVLL